MSQRRARFQTGVALVLTVVAAACDLNPIARPSDRPIQPGSTVFQLVQIQHDLDRALNIVFVPDTSYGDMAVLANRQTFLTDLGNVVDTGYWQNNAFVRNVHLTNFFYMTAAGTAAAPTTGICPTVTWPAQVTSDAAFADLILLIHTNTLRDCRRGNRATTEPTSFGTVVHESAHALFNLPDEYCCDGGYREVRPVLYDTSVECTSDAANAAWRDCRSFVATSGAALTWWRSEDSDADIMSSSGIRVAEFGVADWVVVENVLDDLGTPSTPTVFAPDPWDRP